MARVMVSDDTGARYLRLTIGASAWRLPIDVIEAVILTPRITRTPGAPDRLLGLINYQGEPCPVLSPVASAPGRHTVVVRSAAFRRFGICCDWADGATNGGDPELDAEEMAADIARDGGPRELLLASERPAATAILRPRAPESAGGQPAADTTTRSPSRTDPTSTIT